MKFIITLFLAISMLFVFPMNLAFAIDDADPRIDAVDQANQGVVGDDGQRDQYVSKGQAAASFCGPVNVKNSLVLSVITLCFGGILEKTEQWRQIKCQTVVCNYEAIKNGLDPSFCTQQESFLTCSYIVGELFAIPPMAILEYYRQAIANLLANPIGILWGASVKVARLNVLACTTAAPCGPAVVPPAVFLAVSDIAGVIQTISDIFDNGFFGLFSGNQVNYCEQVDDIKVEMEEILGR